MSKAGPARGKSRGKSPGAPRDDGFVLFEKPATPMRAVVTACGHGGIVPETEDQPHTRVMTKEATSALQHDTFGFYVFRVQGNTYSPGLSWSSAGDMPSNFSQYNPEIALLLKEADNHTLLETGDLRQLAGNIGDKIKEIDKKSGVKYGSREEKKTHPTDVVSGKDFYIMYTPDNPPREDHRLIATYAGPGEMLRPDDKSVAQLPRREAVGDMANIRFFKSYGLFCVDSTDDVERHVLCLTGAHIESKRADERKKTTEYHELAQEGLYNLFRLDKIGEVVHLMGWRNGFFRRKETDGVVTYKIIKRKTDRWKRFHDDPDGPVQTFLHAAFYQEISYPDIISIWKDGLLYDEVLFLDVACNCPSEKVDWDYFTPRRTLTVSAMMGRDPRDDGYYKPDPAGSATPPSSSSDSSDSDSSDSSDSDPGSVAAKSPPRAKPPSPPRAKSPPPAPSRAKPPPRAKSLPRSSDQKKGGRSRLTKRSKSYQKTSKQLKTSRKRLSRNKKNNTTRRKRYTRRRTRR